MRWISKVVVIGLVGAASAASADSTFKWYGFVLPFYSLSTVGMETFSNPNQGAVTAVGNPVLAGATRDEIRSTWQVAQSRFGFTVDPTPDWQARVELDFIDFSKSSPTTAAVPRLRRALINWNVSPEFKIVAGQDWDLTSPLMPFTYNYVGHFFEAGDIGFMRHQLQTIWTHGHVESALALGLQQQTAGNAENATEMSFLPTVAWRETFKGENWSTGFSALAAAPKAAAASATRLASGALTVFGSSKSSEWELRTEAYVGRNTANLGLLGLSFCNATVCSSEAGLYVSAKRSFTNWSTFLSAGGAAMLEPNSMLESYSGTTPALAGTGPGIENNWTLHWGADRKLAEDVLLWTEVSYWNTRHHLAAGATVAPQRDAVLVQIGSQVNL